VAAALRPSHLALASCTPGARGKQRSIDLHVASNRAVFHPTEDWHGYLAYALFGLAGAHALIALWHQFVLRDGLLARMWPRAS
jgi:cytochrome b561